MTRMVQQKILLLLALTATTITTIESFQSNNKNIIIQHRPHQLQRQQQANVVTSSLLSSRNNNNNDGYNDDDDDEYMDMYTDRNGNYPRSTRPVVDDDDGGGNRKSSPSSSMYSNMNTNNNNNDLNNNMFSRMTRPVEDPSDLDKFDMQQRIESVKAGIIGAICGGIAIAPISYFHYSDTLAQWEFSTDMAAIQAALFAIVYRYAIRYDDNPMLNQGVVGAFVFVRTLSNIHTSPSCLAVPLRCGEPLGYLDWEMLNQAAVFGIESAFLFGGAAVALDFAFSKGWLSKFD